MKAGFYGLRRFLPAVVYEWETKAACRRLKPEAADALFYPEDNQQPVEAKEFCGWCPVQQQCLDTALGNGEPYGIWGGKDPRERQVLLRRRGSRTNRYIEP